MKKTQVRTFYSVRSRNLKIFTNGTSILSLQKSWQKVVESEDEYMICNKKLQKIFLSGRFIFVQLNILIVEIFCTNI